jgi:hypothetical protein
MERSEPEIMYIGGNNVEAWKTFGQFGFVELDLDVSALD